MSLTSKSQEFLISQHNNSPRRWIQPPAKAQQQRYSIWLPFTNRLDDQHKKLNNLVEALSEQYSTYPFTPHITLIGGLSLLNLHEIRQACSQVTEVTPELHISLRDITKGSMYYKCVYGLFDTSSTHTLTNLHKHLRKTLATLGNINEEEVDPIPINEFEPHISFIYGIEETEKKNQIISTIKKELWENRLDTSSASSIQDFNITLKTLAVVEANLTQPFINPRKIPTSMSSLLGRILLQVVFLYGNAITKTFLQIYKHSALHMSVNSMIQKFNSRMGIDEAKKILGLPIDNITLSDVNTKFAMLYKMNQPTDSFLGSPYLQKKIQIAQIILTQYFKKIT